jgi:hypothetical protein
MRETDPFGEDPFEPIEEGEAGLKKLLGGRPFPFPLPLLDESSREVCGESASGLEVEFERDGVGGVLVPGFLC